MDLIDNEMYEKLNLQIAREFREASRDKKRHAEIEFWDSLENSSIKDKYDKKLPSISCLQQLFARL